MVYFKNVKIFLVIFIGISLIFSAIKVTYSKFIQGIETNAIAGVAKFAFSMHTENPEIIKDVLNQEELVYEFSVQNFSGNVSNEVKSSYNIILELSQESPPLIIELYRVVGETEEMVDLENDVTKNPEIFEIGDKTVNYRIKVRYDKNNQTAVLQEGFYMKMRVVSVQEEV